MNSTAFTEDDFMHLQMLCIDSGKFNDCIRLGKQAEERFPNNLHCKMQTSESYRILNQIRNMDFWYEKAIKAFALKNQKGQITENDLIDFEKFAYETDFYIEEMQITLSDFSFPPAFSLN